jgi:hypothetical protein
LFPWVDGAWFGFELPAFGVEPGVPFVAFGSVPHGDPPGELPGVADVFGVMVDGWVVPFGVGVVGELEPGTVEFPFDELDPCVF